MKRLLRSSKLLLASVVLALGGFSIAAIATPAAHAAGTSISAFGEGGGVQVYGFGCNPGASVRVELLTHDNYMHVLATKYVTASTASGPTAPGTFMTLINTSYVGYVYVAMDCYPGPTAWATAYVYPAPWITVTGYAGNLTVDGSGFTPGTWEQVQVYIAGTWTMIGSAWVEATYGTQNENGFTSANLHVNYVGNVLVREVGSPSTSNWVEYWVN